MEILAVALIGIGGIISFVFWIIILIKAFKVHVGWGLGSLFVSPVMLVFVCMHWKECKKPFLLSLTAIPLLAVGYGITFKAAASAAGIDSLDDLKGMQEQMEQQLEQQIQEAQDAQDAQSN